MEPIDPGDGDPGTDPLRTPAPIPPEKFATSPGGVDMRSGFYAYSHTDLSIGDDHGMKLDRTLPTGLKNFVEPFGFLSHNWLMFVTEGRSRAPYANTFDDWDYNVSVHGLRSASFWSLYNPSAYSFQELSTSGFNRLSVTTAYYKTNYWQPTSYTLTAEDGTIIYFDLFTGACSADSFRCAYARYATMPDGTRYDFSYDAQNKLRKVVSNWGYALVFDYSASQVSKACVLNLTTTTAPAIAMTMCPSGATSSTYSYTSSALSSYIDQSGATTQIGSNLSAIYAPGASTPFVTNTLTDRIVTAQSFADGRTYSYSWLTDQNYYQSGASSDGQWHVVGGTATDQAGRKITVGFEAEASPKSNDPNTIIWSPSPNLIKDQNGNQITATYCKTIYGTCYVYPMQTRTDAEGAVTEFTYDSYRNVTQKLMRPKPGSGLANITTSATYGCGSNPCIAKPTAVTDGRGNTTNFTYNTTTGQVLTETKPADANGVQPVKRYAYVSRKAWVSNGSGGFVQTGYPVSLLSTEKTCRTTATNVAADSCAGGASDETVTSYDYGPDTGAVGNNLWLRGMAVTAYVGGTATTLRTCYGYDATGNRISETKPRAGLTQC